MPEWFKMVQTFPGTLITFFFLASTTKDAILLIVVFRLKHSSASIAAS